MAPDSIVQGILTKGYTFVSVNYRLSGESKYPAAVQDFFRATEYLKMHTTKLSLDAKRIYFFGQSAAANIVALAGLAANNPVFNQEKIQPRIYIKPLGVIALYPPVDFTRIEKFQRQQCCKDITPSSGLSFEEQYLSGRLVDNLDKVKVANPVTYVATSAPNFLIENGSNDCSIGSQQSKLLVNALRENGNTVIYHELAGAGHGGLEFETTQNIRQLLDFLK
jgi:acetyl esterase/lipase